MKPRIRKVGPWGWLCGAANGMAAGRSPLEAYLNWKANPQVLFK